MSGPGDPVTAPPREIIGALVRTIEEWYVQDQGGYLGETRARAMAHQEVAAVRAADAWLEAQQ